MYTTHLGESGLLEHLSYRTPELRAQVSLFSFSPAVRGVTKTPHFPKREMISDNQLKLQAMSSEVEDSTQPNAYHSTKKVSNLNTGGLAAGDTCQLSLLSIE